MANPIPTPTPKKSKLPKIILIVAGVLFGFLVLGTIIVLSIIYIVSNASTDKVSEYLSSDTEQVDEEEAEEEEEYHPIVELKASVRPTDHLAPQGRNTYVPQNLLDNNNNTAWVVNSSMANYGHDIDLLEFDVDAKHVDYIMLTNGYAKSWNAFNNNARAGSVYISRVPWDMATSSDILYQGSLEDHMSPQRLKVSSSYDNKRPTKKIYVRFGSDVVHGAKYYDDFCISEIHFFGY